MFLNWDWTALRFLLDLIMLLSVMTIGIYSWWVTRNQVIKSDIVSVSGRVDAVEERVTLVERDIRNLPTPADVSEINQRIASLHGDLREIKGSLRGLTRAVDLMNEHLINRGNRE